MAFRIGLVGTAVDILRADEPLLFGLLATAYWRALAVERRRGQSRQYDYRTGTFAPVEPRLHLSANRQSAVGCNNRTAPIGNVQSIGRILRIVHKSGSGVAMVKVANTMLALATLLCTACSSLDL